MHISLERQTCMPHRPEEVSQQDFFVKRQGSRGSTHVDAGADGADGLASPKLPAGIAARASGSKNNRQRSGTGSK